jgi:hypothetical protein
MARLYKTIGVLAAALLVAVGILFASVSASAGTTTFNSVTLTSAAASSSTSAAVSFKTATTGTIATIDVALPNFSGASPSVSNVSGIGAGTVASSGSGIGYKVTYTVTSPASVSSNTTISFTLSGLTTPGSTGNQSVAITTKTSAPATIDSGNTLVAIVANGATSVTANVAQALTVSIGGSGSYTLNVDPSGTAFENTSSYAVSLATNAKNGATTTVSIANALTGTVYASSSIPAVAGTFDSLTSNTGKPPVNTWGINNDGTSNTWAGPTTGGIAINNSPGGANLSPSGPTNSVSQNHVIGVNVDYETPADSYTTTVKYVFTPNF